MASRITCVIIFFLIARSVIAGEVTITGVYQGKNLFIRNPYLPDKKEFCITQIFVNDIALGHLPKSSAIQVDLSHLQINQAVTVKIIHSDECNPVIVNAEVIREGREFAFLFIQIDDNSINWITTGETPDGTFEIEKLKWEGWEKMMDILAKGQFDNNQYSIEASHYTGDNTYRLNYINGHGKRYLSDEESFYSLLDPIILYQGDKIFDWISLSRDTDYKIFDDYDSLLMAGFGSEINVSSLDYGDYYIILEDEPLRFNKPKPEFIPRKKRKKSKDNKNKE